MKKYFFALSLLILGFFFVLQTDTKAEFSDVAGHQYEKAIGFIEAQNIVQGYDDGTYKPDSEINRAEFTKIIINAIVGKTPVVQARACLSDVPASEWFQPFVCYAVANKIIGGYPDGRFKGANNINFAEAAKIVTLAFKHEIRAVGAGEQWYEPFVEKLQELGAVPPTIASISDPGEQAGVNLRRGEMAYIIQRLKGETITSDDGKAKLFIPDGALPDGVSAEDISVSKLAKDDELYSMEGFEDAIGYALEPDGTKFEEPVELSSEYSLSDTSGPIPVPALFSISDDGTTEIIPGSSIVIDLGSSRVLVAGELTHFSRAGIIKSEAHSSGVSIEQTVIGDTPVGEYLDFETKLSGLQDVEAIYTPVGASEPVEDEFTGFTGTMAAYFWNNLDKKYVNSVPPFTAVNPGGSDTFTHKSTKDFKCLFEGPQMVITNYDLRYEYIQDDLTRRYSSSVSLISDQFECTKPIPFEVKLLNPGDQDLNTDFEIRTEVKASGYDPDTYWYGRGEIAEYGSAVPLLTPVDPVVDKRMVTRNESQTFRCSKKGDTGVIYTLHVWNDVNRNRKQDEGETEFTAESEPVLFSCLDDEPAPEQHATFLHERKISCWDGYEIGPLVETTDETAGFITTFSMPEQVPLNTAFDMVIHIEKTDSSIDSWSVTERFWSSGVAFANPDDPSLSTYQNTTSQNYLVIDKDLSGQDSYIQTIPMKCPSPQVLYPKLSIDITY